MGLYIIGLTALAKYEALPGVAKHWPAVAVMLPAVSFVAQRPSLAALPILLLFVGWVCYSLSFAYRKLGRSIGGAIGRLIAGVALCDALVLAAAGAWLGVALALAAFGLTPSLIGPATPRLRAFAERGALATVEHVLPAVTCSVQATYLTGTRPGDHGIVGNGWYFRDEGEVKFWRQSNQLIQRPSIWELA